MGICICVGGQGCKISYAWYSNKIAINPAHTANEGHSALEGASIKAAEQSDHMETLLTAQINSSFILLQTF